MSTKQSLGFAKFVSLTEIHIYRECLDNKYFLAISKQDGEIREKVELPKKVAEDFAKVLENGGLDK